MNSLYEWISKYQSLDEFILTKNRGYSYKDFFLLCSQAKKILQPLQAGDILMFSAKSPVEILIFLIGCLEKGGHFLPIYEKSTNEERIILRKKIYPHWEISNGKTLQKSQTYELNTKLNLSPGIIFQTSGGTGNSRFVHQSQENLLDNAYRASQYQCMNNKSKIFMPLTLSHSGGLNMQTLPAFIVKGRIHLESIQNILELEKVFDKSFTHTTLVPFHFRQIIKLKRWKKANFSWKMRILTGSCPIPNDFFEQAKSKKAHLLSVYGLTEIGPFVSTVEKKIDLGENIFPIGNGNGDFKLDISSQNEEILVKGPCMGKYIKREKYWLTHDCGNPWVFTGDRGKYKDGHLCYLGKIKREINLAGYKINPEEVEEVLKRHSQVQDCVVYAEKNDLYNEIPVVKIVATGVSSRDIYHFLRKKLTKFKIPRKIFFVENLDKRTSIGKVKVA
ncbi:MAG: fatty acid--CoA ligase family protein [Halobacteriovoraceae bacterium]|nr:fatty acid--CoA ligase family protein [Halobacteriovoraceae bacterium]